METNFTGVVAPDVTENEKNGPETRADDIKSDGVDRKIRESLPVDSDRKN